MSSERRRSTEKSRSTVRRLPKRASYAREDIDAIIDEALVCHVGLADNSEPVVIPTIHARDGDRLLLHGLKGGRLLKHIEAGNEVCVAITLLDGVVLARSAFHHSLNYRSVVLFGKGEVITDDAQKIEALRRITEHIVPGRWQDTRPPSPKELKVTTVVAIGIEEASAKVRTGGPIDDEADHALPFWAGVVPLRLVAGEPEDDDRLAPGATAPGYAASYARR